MRVEEMALRSEIRQMLNEAGYNKNTLKELVKQVLDEQLNKAIMQAINESTYNFKEYIHDEINRNIKKTLMDAIRKEMVDKLVSSYFGRLKVDVTFPNWNEVIKEKENNNENN